MTTSDSTSQAALAEYVQRARTLVEPQLRKAVSRLDEPMHTAVGYHYGWWDENARPVRADSGKAIRASLTLLGAQAVGGDVDEGIDGAVAVELVHNFSLIHDDLIDGDELRRHRPTVWSVFGMPSAVLGGDALLALAGEILAEAPSPRGAEALRVLFRALRGMVNGQGADLLFEQATDVGLDGGVDMALNKTGELLGCACALGALLAGAQDDVVEKMRRFGLHAGLAFQIADDVLGIWGDPAVTGKPAYSDLRSRKKTLPVVAALAADDDAGRELGLLYHADRTLDDHELPYAASLVEQSGGRRWAHDQARAQIDKALSALTATRPEAEAEAHLTALAHLMADRSH